MDKLTFEKVTDKDFGELTSISIKAFHSDIEAGASVLKGPPGYDSVSFHKEMRDEATCFYKIILNDKIIGAFWFMETGDKKGYIYRIFIDPSYHKMGIGLKTFDFIFSNFPWIKKWSLKTPVWNRRTPPFYLKAGFEVAEKTSKFIYFEKEMGARTP